jgi:hypothetical protein
MNGLKTVDAVTERNNLRIENERLRGDIERLNAENDRLVQERNESIRDHGHALNLWTEAKSQLAAVQESLSQVRREIAELRQQKDGHGWKIIDLAKRWEKEEQPGAAGNLLCDLRDAVAEYLALADSVTPMPNSQAVSVQALITAGIAWNDTVAALSDYEANLDTMERLAARSREALARIELQRAISKYREQHEAATGVLMSPRSARMGTPEAREICDDFERRVNEALGDASPFIEQTQKTN